MALIKVLNENNEVVDGVRFVDNLTIPDAPPYRNFNGKVGLTRCTSERNHGRLVIMYYYEEKQEDSYAEFISDEEAYRLCEQRNKLDVADDLNLDLTKERVVL